MKNLETQFNEKSQPDGKRDTPRPFCLRLSRKEREDLERRAGNKPLAAYIRSQLFNETMTIRRKCRKAPSENNKLVSQIVFYFGKSHFSQNIAQLALATQNSPQLFTSELCLVVLGAKNDVEAIGKALHQKITIKNVKLLKQLLDRLKNPYIANRLNSLAVSIHIGAFVLSPEVHELILEICADIDSICTMLHKAVEIK